MYKLLRTFLFLLAPESAHAFTTSLFQGLCKIPGVPALFRAAYQVRHPNLKRQLFGLTFPNPVGLAAGFDKNADYLHAFQHLGFGFLEVGTITPKGQPGNEQPRLFRLKSDHALINRMGFNNEGLDYAVEKLRNRPKSIIVGGNIGKNKVTPNEKALEDYLKCYEALHPYVDYFVVNVSSPNTPNLRELQEKEPLTELLQTLMQRNREESTPRPILLKIAPDLTESQLDDILEIVDTTGLDGIIATNTTISREGLQTKAAEIESIGAGGLSGEPLDKRATEVIRYLRKGNSSLPIIGVGGVHDVKSAREKIDAGATLLQLYTGFIYEGPGLIRKINQSILSSADN